MNLLTVIYSKKVLAKATSEKMPICNDLKKKINGSIRIFNALCRYADGVLKLHQDYPNSLNNDEINSFKRKLSIYIAAKRTLTGMFAQIHGKKAQSNQTILDRFSDLLDEFNLGIQTLALEMGDFVSKSNDADY